MNKRIHHDASVKKCINLGFRAKFSARLGKRASACTYIYAYIYIKEYIVVCIYIDIRQSPSGVNLERTVLYNPMTAGNTG